ncbi:MAG: PKD domain-containing protein [Methanomicrobiaceae archaeon]|nr:PKD domain-containing protein [Methanomicrobiaceae archaeon]
MEASTMQGRLIAILIFIGYLVVMPVSAAVPSGGGSYGLAPPVADFTVSLEPAPPFTVKFTDTSSGQVESYSWNFGDSPLGYASPGSDATTTHTYGQAGIYTARLTVTNSGGSDTMTKEIAVGQNSVELVPSNPSAMADADVFSGTAPLEIHFTDASVYYTTSKYYPTWDFGDGTYSLEANPVHTFTQPGTYTVTLAATNLGGTDYDSLTVTVYPAAVLTSHTPVGGGALGLAAPVTGFEVDTSQGLIVEFIDTSSGQVESFSWDFGDGSVASGMGPDASTAHEYANPGEYQVSLAVSNSGGTDTVTRTIIVFFVPPPDAVPDVLLAEIDAMPLEGPAPLTVQFADRSTGNIVGREWNFGDGSFSDLPNPVHTYMEPGIYTVHLTVAAPGFGEDTAAIEIVVSGEGSLPEEDEMGGEGSGEPPAATKSPLQEGEEPSPTQETPLFIAPLAALPAFLLLRRYLS